jgi:hypothetical protein
MGWPHRSRVASPTVDPVRPGVVARHPVNLDGLTKHQQFIYNKFRGQLHFSNHLDVQTGRLWDCLDYLPGQTFYSPDHGHISFFTNVEQSSGKSFAETNLYTNGRLDAPEAFAVERIVFTFSKSISPEDLQQWMDHIVFRFWLGHKHYVWSPIGHMQTVKQPGNPIKICDFCQSVYVESVQCPGCGANSFKLSTFGSAEAGQQFFMDVYPEILIMNQTSFYVSVESRYPIIFNSKVRVWCHLEGFHARGVQCFTEDEKPTEAKP